MDNFETESVSGILDRTPRNEPFYSEVRGAIEHIKAGDASESPLFSIIHGHIGALSRAGRLSQTWKNFPTSGGTVVAHEDFLNIQNEFPKLEMNQGDAINWNAESSVDALGNYLGRMKQYRQRHTNLYRNSLQYLTPSQAEKVSIVANNHTDLMSDDNDLVFVAAPSHLDNPKLWEEFNLRGKLLDHIPPWVKINSRGVILGSRNFRDDKPKGHDYFSYAARAVRLGEAKSMEDKLLLTAQHEGSHGLADAVLIDLLRLGADNPICEGLAGALGEDGREKRPSPSFAELMTNPHSEDMTARRDTAYYSGTKFWEALRRRVSKQGMDKMSAWSRVFGVSMAVATDLSNQPEFMNRNSAERISRFLTEVPMKLDIKVDDLEKEYNFVADSK